MPIPHTLGARDPFFSPDGAWLGFVQGDAIRRVPLAGGPALTVCRVETTPLGASWGTNDVIVFARHEGLWLVPASGGGARLLSVSDTARGVWYRWPDVLPTGRAALFTRVDASGFHLGVVSLETGVVRPLGLEGTNPRYVAAGYVLFTRTDGVLLAAPFDAQGLRVTGPAIPVTEDVEIGGGGRSKLGASRTGTLAYVTRHPRDRTVAMVDRSGYAQTLALPPRGFDWVRVSPDGRRIAMAVLPADDDRHDIWLLDQVTGTFRPLTLDYGSQSPVWSPDGRRIAFATRPGNRGPGWSIRWIAADGDDAAAALLPFEGIRFPAAFTPDGRTLLLQVNQPASGWDIFLLALAGTGESSPSPYLNGPSDEHSPALSPDGRWLAYVSNEAGREEVYVRPFRTRGVPVQVSAGGGREPRWAPSGRELLYRGEGGMIAAMITTAPSVRVTQRVVLFDDAPYMSAPFGAAYDVHPDGRRFVMIRLGAESPQVVVMVNWLDQLRATRRATAQAGESRP